jgi:hypothetical protein
MLTCSICGRRLRVECFGRDRSRITGKRSSCRECQKERDQARYREAKRKREARA